MEKISAVVYTAPDGADLTLTKAPQGWDLVNGSTGETVHTPGMGPMIAYIRTTYGWPLPAHTLD